MDAAADICAACGSACELGVVLCDACSRLRAEGYVALVVLDAQRRPTGYVMHVPRRDAQSMLDLTHPEAPLVAVGLEFYKSTRAGWFATH